MKNKFIAWSLLFLLIVIPSRSASAQVESPYVIHSTNPISEELTDQLNAWLAVDPPSSAAYYIVTYAKQMPALTQVSLAGVDLDSPTLDEDWSLFENGDQVVWIGSVTVLEDGYAAAEASV